MPFDPLSSFTGGNVNGQDSNPQPYSFLILKAVWVGEYNLVDVKMAVAAFESGSRWVLVGPDCPCVTTWQLLFSLRISSGF